MSKRLLPLSCAAAITLAVPAATPVRAAEPAAVHAVKTTGAMTLETQGRATDGTLVRQQRGFAAPASARWIATPAREVMAGAPAL